MALLAWIGCGAWTAAAAERCSLDALEWLLGYWRHVEDDTVLLESWQRVSAATWEGQARTLAGGELKSSEDLRLVQMEGEVFYIPKVAHNDLPVAFRLAACSDTAAVFENPGHDFPTRIEYRPAGAGRFSAVVSGAGGEGFQVEFKRVEHPRDGRTGPDREGAQPAGPGKRGDLAAGSGGPGPGVGVIDGW